MRVGVLGAGAFGSAIAHILSSNGHSPEIVDVDDTFTRPVDVLCIVVPSEHLPAALATHKAVITATTVLVNCTKGMVVSGERSCLVHEFISDQFPDNPYVTLSGPSFASELQLCVPTMVNVGTTNDAAWQLLEQLFTNDWFRLERVGTTLELELAGVMKNVYAVAAGYVAGTGGGRNTHAHLQVVALREFSALVHALEGEAEVIRPGVVGDLVLTCTSAESRNYQYGQALAKGTTVAVTAEGAKSAASLLEYAVTYQVSLPLAAAVASLVSGEASASVLYNALGFSTLEL